MVVEGRALAKIGLATESPVSALYVRFSLTDDGKKLLTPQEIQPDPAHFLHGAFCYGHLVLGKVTAWETPVKVADYEGTTAHYTYRVNDVPAWAKRPELRHAFPLLASDLDGNGQGKWPVQLLNGEWLPKPM